jgi:hypothetical protein
MKLDDWVTVKGEEGVVSNISPDGQVTVRVPQIDWPFPRYITVPCKEVKKHKQKETTYEEATL